MNKIDSPQLLFWEDEAAGSGRWWLARARETVAEGRIDYFIAEDDLTSTLVAVALAPRARSYRVIAVAPFNDDIGLLEALDSLKAAVAGKTARPGGIRWPVHGWRLLRFASLLRRDLPLALAGLAGGAALGLAVAFVAGSSRFSGWPLVLAGLAIGATAGPGLKHLVDRNVGAAYPRPWARFAVTLVAAITGATLAAGIVLTMYWS
ncbi:MAG: hypothetical protein ACYCZX_13850 [Rhodospirillaceae bacterium]